jgi:dimethyl sulfoxide reductase iron-sulfur subunit
LSISRRQLLRSLAGVFALAATAKVGVLALGRRGLSAQVDGGDAKPRAARQWAMVIDLRRCDGCKECTEACQRVHYLPEDQEWIKVYEVESKDKSYFMPRLCMQCENAPCLKVCPVAATYSNPEGVVLIDQDRCIGCRLCMAACPYGSRYFNYSDPPKPPSPFDNPMPEFPVPQQKGTVGKCILCVHYVDKGQLPACVEACRMDALYVADLNSQVMTNRSGETYRTSDYLKENDAFRYKEKLNTSPRVWYVPGHGQDLEGRHRS